MASIKLAPFTPSGAGVLTHALDLLQLKESDILVDLGCGDARLLVHAASEIGNRSYEQSVWALHEVLVV